MIILRYLIFCLICISCIHYSNNPDTDQAKRKAYIADLINKVGFIKLPFSYDILNPNFESKYVTKSNSPDTLLFKIENTYVYGFLPDTSNYYCILYFQVGDLIYPKLITIDKSGTLIDKVDLCLNVCGAPVDIDSSINRFEIDNELNIKSHYYCHGKVFTNDSISKEVEVDDKTEAVGKINENGIIEIKINKLH